MYFFKCKEGVDVIRPSFNIVRMSRELGLSESFDGFFINHYGWNENNLSF